MKFIKFILITAILLIACNINAQRYETAKSIQASVGILQKGISTTVGYEKNIDWNNAFLIEVGLFTEKENIIHSDVKAKFTNFTLGAKYHYYVFAYGNIFPVVGLGAFVGYEQYTNKKDVPTHIKMNRKDDFIFGINSDFGIEYNLKSSSIFITYSPMYEFKQKDYIHNGRIGYKYIF